MIALLDTSVWLDFTRTQTPAGVRQFVSEHIFHPSAHLAEPVVFELMRHAVPREIELLGEQFGVLPMLETPENLWRRAADLGQTCRRKGHTAGALDLLIAGVALAHGAVIVTLDKDFETIGKAGGFAVRLLRRPGLSQ